MRGILINMYQLVPPKQRELRTKITVCEPGKEREKGGAVLRKEMGSVCNLLNETTQAKI